MRLRLPGVLLALCAHSFLAEAQCRPPKNSNEARLLAFYEAPIVFSQAAPPSVMSAGSVWLGGEIIPVPTPSRELRRTGECFLDKTERTTLARIFGRPRIAFAPWRGVTVEASYVPPIKIEDAEPNLFSTAVSYTMPLRRVSMGGEPRLVFRAHGTLGSVRGPITCPRSALQQTSSTQPCYGSEPSHDTFKPQMFGVEASAGWGTSISRLTGYAGAGVNFLRPRFQVGFTTGTGFVDNTEMEVDLTRLALFSGAAFHATQRIDLALQVYSVPADVTTFRFAGVYLVR